MPLWYELVPGTLAHGCKNRAIFDAASLYQIHHALSCASRRILFWGGRHQTERQRDDAAAKAEVATTLERLGVTSE